MTLGRLPSLSGSQLPHQHSGLIFMPALPGSDEAVFSGGPAWCQSCRRQGDEVSTCVSTAYVPDGSYSYMTNSASEFLHSLTSPGAPEAQVIHSQVEVRPAWR